MRCKVGYWRTGLAVQLDEEGHDWLKTEGRALCAQVQANRRILLVACARGASMSKFSAHHRNDPGFFCVSEVVPPYLEFMAGPSFELPRFELHELQLDYDYAMDGLLTEPLAANHLLPWPREKGCRERMSAEEVRHQCYLRIKSHMLEGGHGMFDEVGVPREIVRNMAGGYPMALDKARREVDMLARAA